MIVTLGGRFGGYGLYLLKGKPVFNYNLLNLQQYRWESGAGARDWLGSALSLGAHTIVFDLDEGFNAENIQTIPHANARSGRPHDRV
jgi:hypothetical protein